MAVAGLAAVRPRDDHALRASDADVPNVVNSKYVCNSKSNRKSNSNMIMTHNGKHICNSNGNGNRNSNSSNK